MWRAIGTMARQRCPSAVPLSLSASSRMAAGISSSSLSRSAHSEGIYVHHTSGGPSRDSVSVIIGLLNALKGFRPGIGFFCPVDKNPAERRRSKVIGEIFKFGDDLQRMYGVTHARAYELTEFDKVDDLLEEIFKAYEAYKVNHDFVVVEGTSFKNVGDDITLLNARIASTLGLPALMVTNTRKAAGVAENRIVRWDHFDWAREVMHSAKASSLVFKRNFVEVMGSVVYRVPSIGREDAMKKIFQDVGICFLGAIPEDSLLRSIKVQDMVTVLGAEVFHGSEQMIINEADGTRFIVGTSQLTDLLPRLKASEGNRASIVLISEADRADILLGALNSHQLKSFSTVAAIVLTGGKKLAAEVELMMKEGAFSHLPPILFSSEPLFETAATLADLEGQILPDSLYKIERSGVLFNQYVEADYIMKFLSQERNVPMNPKILLYNIFTRAKQLKQNIVLPEGDEPRTVQAAGKLLRVGICDLTLLGEDDKIKELAKEFQVDLSAAKIIKPSASENLQKYVDILFESRKHKGLTREEAYTMLVQDVNYFGTCMVAAGDADGMVSGAIHTTAETIRPALQIIKTEPGLSIASSIFFMCLQGKVLVFGDCAINTNPTSEELAAIAIASADTAAAFGIQPRVALLSYATGDSNFGPLIQKVIDATAIAKKRRPDLFIDGPLQYDAAVNPETARLKLKGKDSPVAGKANVLIFPDLNTGNNTYKAVQQSTGTIAMGPVIQGLRKPVNDLSRGCTVEDIVATVAITAVQAGTKKESLTQKRTDRAAGG